MKKLLCAISVMLTGFAHAATIRPAVLYSGDKFDKSFNQGVFDGMEKFRKETGISYKEFEPTAPSQWEQALRALADAGHDPIIVVSFAQVPVLAKVAPEYPDTRFSIIDGVVDLPNVQSITFREHEGSFLVGMLAALSSQSGVIGFVGGMDIPLIRRFACGYRQGANFINAHIQVHQDMAGTTEDAWNDPSKGKELALAQFERGADVVFAAAGLTGFGALEAASEEGKLAIGVDSNQNHLFPGTMLTSMLKRVDTAAYSVCLSALDNSWTPNLRNMGLAEGGVDWALDEHNRHLVSEDMRRRLESARRDIIRGTLVVHDYTATGSCQESVFALARVLP